MSIPSGAARICREVGLRAVRRRLGGHRPIGAVLRVLGWVVLSC
jgi:hypothetical protein